MQDLIHSLIRIGFSENESAVYIALLELGASRGGIVARKASVNRATTYSVLETLRKKGLVFTHVEAGERWFTAEPPERIALLLQRERRSVEEKEDIAKRLLMRLKVIENAEGTRPKIRYVESVDGLRAMQKEYEAHEEDIIQIIGYDTFCLLCPPSTTRDHRSELKEQKRRVRSILVTEKNLGMSDELGDEFVCIPPDVLDIHGEMSVCGDRLLLFSYQEGIIAVEVHSKTIAGTARGALELAWKEAERWAKNRGGDWMVGKANALPNSSDSSSN